MIKYFSTGEFYKQTLAPSRFINRQASRGDGNQIDKRNFEDYQEYDFKAAQHANSTSYHEKSYKKINRDYNDNYFKQQYNSSEPLKKLENENQSQYFTPARLQNLNEPSHLCNWKIVKERKFAMRAQKEAFQTPSEKGSFINKSEYESKLHSVNNKNSSTENMLSRENLYYVTKPLLRLDNDLKHKPRSKNTLTISDDTPSWCQSTKKFYTPENSDPTQKINPKKLPPADIFGNVQLSRKNDPNNKIYPENPFFGQRFEKARMCVFYEKTDKVRKTVKDGDLKQSKVKIEWPEEPEKQHFEVKLPSKIGKPDQIYLKKLQQKKDPNFPKVEKIGAPDVYKKIEKDKPIQLKIGHGSPSILNPIKY